MKAFIALTLLIAGVSCSIRVIRIEDGDAYDGSSSLVRVEPAVLKVDNYGSELRTQIPITRLTHEIRGGLSDDLEYSTGNGISVSEHTQVLSGGGSPYEDEQGRLVQSDSSLQKTGGFSYTSPEGLPINLNYVADENGFRAEGAHLPRPVELPAEHAQIHAEVLARVGGSSYGSYEAPALRLNSYDAAPAVVRVESYDATPALRLSSYDSAPEVMRVQSYDAPAPALRLSAYDSSSEVIRVQSYNAPVRSSYAEEAPVIIREVPTVVRVIAPPPITTFDSY